VSPAAAARPAAAPPVPAPAPVPRSGTLDDRGVARREAVHAIAWRVRGTVKVTGEVDVGLARFAGAVSVGGPLTADRVAARGTLEVDGPVAVAGTLATDGTFRAGTTAGGRDVLAKGTTRVGGELSAVRGLTGRGTVEAAALRGSLVDLDGTIVVPGPITAGTLLAELAHGSRLGRVTARSATIRGKVPNVVEKVLQYPSEVHVDHVEADHVELAGVDVDFVRSPEVVLGRGAHVTTVEGTVVRRHPSATIGPRSRSPPPYGLRR